MQQQSFVPGNIQGVYQRLNDAGISLWVENDSLRVDIPSTTSRTDRDLLSKNAIGLRAYLCGQRVNSFHESNDKSNNSIHRPFLELVYKAAFYNVDGIHWNRSGDTPAQKIGCDVTIILTSPDHIKIDNKLRFEVYDDIALEYISNDRYNTPGWVEKDLGIDYLCYVFVTPRQAYLLPWQQLKKVWLKNKGNWLELAKNKQQGFCMTKSPNPGYYTLSCAVPIKLLMEQVQGAMSIVVPQ